MLGKHLIIDIYNADPSILKDMDAVGIMLYDAVIKAGAKVITKHFHSFGEDSGFTGILCLADSHLSIHTWPEFGQAAIDAFMCNEEGPSVIVPDIIEIFNADARYEIKLIARGNDHEVR